MPEQQYQDAITYSQPLTLEITDEKTLKLFEDRNYMTVLKFLRSHKGPMTVKELEEAFEKAGEKRSDKTIYRYLKELVEGGLVVQAGKRVYPLEKNKLTTQTLYMRAAKIFFPLPKDGQQNECSACEKDDILMQAVGLLLGKQINAKLNSVHSLNELLKRIHTRKSEIYRKLIREAEIEMSELLDGLDWGCIENLMHVVSSLVLFNDDEVDWQKELKSCFH